MCIFHAHLSKYHVPFISFFLHGQFLNWRLFLLGYHIHLLILFSHFPRKSISLQDHGISDPINYLVISINLHVLIQVSLNSGHVVIREFLPLSTLHQFLSLNSLLQWS